MQQVLHRSSLVPRGFVVEIANYEGDKAIPAVRERPEALECVSNVPQHHGLALGDWSLIFRFGADGAAGSSPAASVATPFCAGARSWLGDSPEGVSLVGAAHGRRSSGGFFITSAWRLVVDRRHASQKGCRCR